MVKLGEDERAELRRLVDEGKGSKEARQRARVLLKADEAEGAPAWTDERVAEFAEVSVSTVLRARRSFVEGGPQACRIVTIAPFRQFGTLSLRRCTQSS